MEHRTRARRPVPAALVAVALCHGGLAGAQVAPAEADLDGDGRPERVELRPGAEGRLFLHLGGTASEASTSSDGLVPAEASLRRVDLGRGRAVGLYRVPRGGGQAFEAILLVRARGARPQVLWSGATGLRGDRGSRWGERVLVEELTGDEAPEVLVASFADEVPLCGTVSPELFPRAVDPVSGSLRPVMLNRLRNFEAEAVPVTATRESPGPSGPPLVEVATFATASTLEGDRGGVEGLAAPVAVADGDPATAWVEGRPGPGSHEFLSARLLPGPYRIRAVALTLSPRGEAGQVRALGRLRTLELVADGASGPRRYSVTVPEDPAGFPGEPVWVALPEPVEASCLAIVLGEVYPGAASPVRTAIAEVDVYTDLDFEGGADRVVEHLGRPESEALLRALGPAAVPALREHWDGLDEPARRRAVRLLAGLSGEQAAELLFEAAAGADPVAAEEARRGLLARGDAAVPSLSAELASELAPRRLAAARLLGAIGSRAAAEALAAALLGAEAERLSELRADLARALDRAGPEVRAAALEAAADEGLARRLVLLSALGAARGAEAGRMAALLLEGWEQAEGFEDRYRVLSLLARTSAEPGVLALLAREAAEEPDQYLRARAIESLGALGRGSPEARAALEAAARAERVRHRLAAARALGSAEAFASPELARLLESDPWPVVRIAAAEALGLAGDARAARSLVRALGDPSPQVAAQVALLLARLGTAEVVGPLAALATDSGQAAVAREAAVRGLGRTCRPEAEPVLTGLLEAALGPRATPGQARIGASAAVALAPFGGEQVTALLARAAREGVPGLRLAAIEAFGRRGGRPAREQLEALQQDSVPPVAAAAAAALRLVEAAGPGQGCPR